MSIDIDGFDWVNGMKKIARWAARGSGLDNGAIVFAGQGGPLPKNDDGSAALTWISLHLLTTNGIGSDEVKLADNPLELAAQTFASVVPGETEEDPATSDVDDAADSVHIADHEYTTGDGPVQLTTTDTLPGGLELATDYWIVVVDDSTVRFTESREGAVDDMPFDFVDITDAGVGTHTISTTENSRRPLEDVAFTTSGHRTAVLSVQCFSDEPMLSNMRAQAVLEKLRNARLLPGQQALMREAGFAVASFGPVSAPLTSGSSSASDNLRAVADVTLNYVDGATETTTYIEDVEIDLEVSV